MKALIWLVARQYSIVHPCKQPYINLQRLTGKRQSETYDLSAGAKISEMLEGLNPFPKGGEDYLTVFTKGVIPWIRTSRRSPDWMGPTPLGVPVRMISPGSSVIFVEIKLTRS